MNNPTKTKTEYETFYVRGKAYWTFAGSPRPEDKLYNKPKMYSIDLVDPEIVATPGSKVKTLSDLKGIGVILKTYNVPAEKPHHDELDGKTYIRFQSKVIDPENEDFASKANPKGRRPRAVDSQRNTFDAMETKIGNGSDVIVKSSIALGAPPPGQRKSLPRFDAIQVIELVPYTGGSSDDSGFVNVDGGFVTGQDNQATFAHDDSPIDADDVFAGLENPEDLEPTAKVTTTKKRKAA